MKIHDFASEFTVLILATDPDWGGEVKSMLTRAGYDSYLITEAFDLPERLRDKNPHVLVFSVQELTGKMSTFVEMILKVTPEIRFVILGETNHFASLSNYEEYGFEQFVHFEKEHLGLRVASAVDRICEKLYYIYQNEQLAEEILNLQEENTKVPAMSLAAAPPAGPTISARVQGYQSALSREALIQQYFENSKVQPLLYFRFLPSVLSFVAMRAAGFDPKDLQGVGCQIEGLSIKDLSTQITLGVVPAPLLEIISGSFKITNPRLQALFSQGQLEGVIVYSGDLEESKKIQLLEEFTLFALAFGHFDLQKRIETLEVQDPVTEVFNRKYYDLKLTEEVERALRIKQAVSLVKIAIDDFFEIEQTLGESARDLLLKKIAQTFLKSSRTTDIVARTGLNEFSMIMPHCHRQGALVRSERLRRIVENTFTLESGLKVSISLGISEYPTLCRSAANLEETTLKALMHISGRGGNKICVYKAPADHAPEFEVRVEPG